MTCGDRGSLSVELVALFGALLLLVLLVVQASCYWFDRQVALDAAREGAAVAADTQTSRQDPQKAVYAFLQRGGWLVTGSSVDVGPGKQPHTVSVAVQVHVQSVLGKLFGDVPITVQVTVPVERFVRAGG